MRSFHLTVDEIIQCVRPVRTAGATSVDITGIAPLDKAQPGDLSFLVDPAYETKDGAINIASTSRYEKEASGSRASVLLLPENFKLEPKENQLLLFVKKSSFALGVVCSRIEKMLYPKPTPGVHPSCVIDRDAQVHPEAHIGPLCVVGPFAQIGKGALLHSGVIVRAHAVIGEDAELKSGVKVLDDCVIGARCILHSGVVIGSDGYGYDFQGGKFLKIPQIGNVVLEDDVELGANTTIDRARFGETRIGQGTKIDNLVQIGHNANIGRNCMIVAQCAIAGSATLEDYVMMGGQAAVAGHVVIGTQAKVAGQSGVNANVAPKLSVTGNPAMELNKAYRVEVLKRKLPELFKRVEKLERK